MSRPPTTSGQTGQRAGEAQALSGLGDVEVRLGRYGPAADHLGQALALVRQADDRAGEAATLDSLGILHTRTNQPAGSRSATSRPCPSTARPATGTANPGRSTASAKPPTSPATPRTPSP